jgi:hypothetical protein
MSETIDAARAAAFLMETLSTTFADMAFIDVEPTRADMRAPGAPIHGGPGDSSARPPVRAAIDVLKPLSCRLEIECPAELKERIEETLFEGQGEGGSEEDSLLEMLNVAAGVFLTLYFGTGADIKLELPEYLYFTEGTEGEILAEASADAEGQPLRAVLRSIRYRY